MQYFPWSYISTVVWHNRIQLFLVIYIYIFLVIWLCITLHSPQKVLSTQQDWRQETGNKEMSPYKWWSGCRFHGTMKGLALSKVFPDQVDIQWFPKEVKFREKKIFKKYNGLQKHWILPTGLITCSLSYWISSL